MVASRRKNTVVATSVPIILSAVATHARVAAFCELSVRRTASEMHG